MGRGNCYVSGAYEGLYYIDNDFLDMYSSRKPDENGVYETRLLGEIEYADMENWEYDEAGSRQNWDDFLTEFRASVRARFGSFRECDERLEHGECACLENGLFYIAFEDNQWSMAIELIQKEEARGLPWMENFQKRRFQRYLDGIRDALFEQFDELGVYGGAWTSGRIRKADYAAA